MLISRQNNNKNTTVIGFDFGMKKIGVAVGQTAAIFAEALCYLKADKGAPNWIEVNALLNTWQPFALIVGKPLNMAGESQAMTLSAENFAQRLESRYGLPVYLVDERLSTIEARAQLFENGGYRALCKTHKKNIDAAAAQIILQEWLNSYEKT